MFTLVNSGGRASGALTISVSGVGGIHGHGGHLYGHQSGATQVVHGDRAVRAAGCRSGLRDVGRGR